MYPKLHCNLESTFLLQKSFAFGQILPGATVCHLLDIDEVPGAATLPQISSDLVEDDQVPGEKTIYMQLFLVQLV